MSLLLAEGLIFAAVILISLSMATGRRLYGRAPALEPVAVSASVASAS